MTAVKNEDGTITITVSREQAESLYYVAEDMAGVYWESYQDLKNADEEDAAGNYLYVDQAGDTLHDLGLALRPLLPELFMAD